ncbi:hypothetical protein ACW4TU_06465 [Streptomyces sp. QTS52]
MPRGAVGVVVMGTGTGAVRTGLDNIVSYDSVGFGVQDAAAAWAVVHAVRGVGR